MNDKTKSELANILHMAGVPLLKTAKFDDFEVIHCSYCGYVFLGGEKVDKLGLVVICKYCKCRSIASTEKI